MRDYRRMHERGVIRADERVELIEGEVVRMSPIGNPHNRIVIRLDRIFQHRLPDCRVMVQGSLTLGSRSMPQPDVTLLRSESDDSLDDPITEADAFLVIEVADSTLRMDLGPKAALYAKHGIREYWVVDVAGARVVVHRDPARGGYRTLLEARPPELLAPLAFPEATVDLAEVFRGTIEVR